MAEAARIGDPTGFRSRPEVTAPGTEKPPWRAERRHALETVRELPKMAAPLGAPLPRLGEGEEGTTAYPGPQRIRAVTHAFSIGGLPAEAPKERRLERWLEGLFEN